MAAGMGAGYSVLQLAQHLVEHWLDVGWLVAEKKWLCGARGKRKQMLCQSVRSTFLVKSDLLAEM